MATSLRQLHLRCKRITETHPTTRMLNSSVFSEHSGSLTKKLDCLLLCDNEEVEEEEKLDIDNNDDYEVEKEDKDKDKDKDNFLFHFSG